MSAVYNATDPSLAVGGHAKAPALFVRNCRMARNVLFIATILVESFSAVDILARITAEQVKECAQETVTSNVQSPVTMGDVNSPVQNHAHLVQKRAPGRVRTSVATSLALL